MEQANAPEKIYLWPSDRAGEEYDAEWSIIPCDEGGAEYLRTDVFIDKALGFIKERFYFDDSWHVEGETSILDKVIEDFKKYIKD